MIKNRKLKTIIEFLLNKKTTSLKVLDISKISIIADYFVIISMDNKRSVYSLSSDLVDFLANESFDLKSKEGGKSKWVLLDYGDVVIHIFDDEYKDFYNLDKLWADAKEIHIEKK